VGRPEVHLRSIPSLTSNRVDRWLISCSWVPPVAAISHYPLRLLILTSLRTYLLPPPHSNKDVRYLSSYCFLWQSTVLSRRPWPDTSSHHILSNVFLAKTPPHILIYTRGLTSWCTCFKTTNSTACSPSFTLSVSCSHLLLKHRARVQFARRRDSWGDHTSQNTSPDDCYSALRDRPQPLAPEQIQPVESPDVQPTHVESL
jgi:hypothetical protein